LSGRARLTYRRPSRTIDLGIRAQEQLPAALPCEPSRPAPRLSTVRKELHSRRPFGHNRSLLAWARDWQERRTPPATMAIQGRKKMITLVQAVKGSPKKALCVCALGVALSGIVAHADEPLTTLTKPFSTLTNQTYALCAGGISFVFDQVAYANCQIMFGTSISLTLSYPPVPATGQPGGNIETVNQQGAAWNSFMVSSFSPPSSLTSPQGDTAIYTCRAGSTGSYAQCDGGICFRSTSNTTFPGLGSISSEHIVCSCPIASPSASYQIEGPYPCLNSEQQHELCNAPVRNGSTLYIGAPTGVPRALSRILNGGNPVYLNECPAH
jgi:hypothetical protein